MTKVDDGHVREHAISHQISRTLLINCHLGLFDGVSDTVPV